MILKIKKSLQQCVWALAVLGFTSNSMAAGFEKAVQWSAKWSALGGNAAASVKGADATYFNPAGLVGGSDKEATFNFSPTFSTFNGTVDPVTNSKESGEQTMSPIFGIGGKYALTPEISLGAMYYVAGGTSAKYDGVTFAGAPGSSYDLLAELAVTEFALAAGYKVNDNLSLGLAWRSTFVSGELKSATFATSPANSVNTVELTGLEDTSYGGFKVGAQYADANWGVGFVYRNSVDFDAEGKATVKSSLSATPVLSNSDVTVSNSLPESYSLDGYYELSMPLVLYFGYTFTKYSESEALKLKGNITSISSLANGIPQKWDDQHNYRLAAEYRGFSMPVRLGYVMTSQVTDDNNASATYASPGTGHTLVAGTGTNLGSGVLDLALEYSFAEGKDKTAYYLAQGDFDTQAYGIHVSYNMAF